MKNISFPYSTVRQFQKCWVFSSAYPDPALPFRCRGAFSVCGSDPDL